MSCHQRAGKKPICQVFQGPGTVLAKEEVQQPVKPQASGNKS